MSASNKDGSSRRQFLGTTTLATAFASLAGPGLTTASSKPAPGSDTGENNDPDIEPFFGTHQSGIVTPSQSHTYFVAFDLITTKQSEVAKLLQAWTEAAARMTAGEPAQDIFSVLASAQPLVPAAYGTLSGAADNYGSAGLTAGPAGGDTGEALDLSPARLTLTFGFGASLFLDNGRDRFGFSSVMPDALSGLPRFPGDQLEAARTGGDISVQACADDQQVAFHAVRQLTRIADGIAKIRWAQVGFLPSNSSSDSPRNLMGFRDGTDNPRGDDAVAMNKIVWVGDEGPAWLRDGSYLVARRIRIALELWDRTTVEVQESTVGRHKYSGAPLGKTREHDPLDLAAADKDGNPVIPETAHVRLAAAVTNDGAQIWRRPYSYNDGVTFIAERERQGLEYDAGLFFVCYQRDPRTGFVKINERLSRFDMMNQYITHVGSGLFACPRGLTKGEFVGQELFESV